MAKIFLSKREIKLRKWLNDKIEKAQQAKEPMFMGIPDKWFEHELHCCNKGHINTRYLITDSGARCLQCGEPSHIFPNNTSESDFKKMLSEL
ncbi:hypothetical protein [Flectobacillus sp. BAB-3569]|uniref:hypothetical protein n=1 Tax=Flectobacillus sp. BAB-3569 TaxID=1509483 RepID=UPI000BA2FC85|nr:hypothetical protein [Flectobacillus sp. BAB-3569]PAC27838.1 hypothetical protein BWI92_21745 [Flectobacillus sp. BAB-3569]